jgi:hypothetical protein
MDAIVQSKMTNPKWKGLRTSNDKTQAQVNANKMGTREGTKPRLSQGFGLDELDA